MCLPLLIFPCTIKSRSSFLAPAHPGSPGKRAVKRLCARVCVCIQPSVLCRCWLGGRNGIRPVKTELCGTGVVICLEQGANDLRMVQLMPLPPYHVLLVSPGFTLLNPVQSCLQHGLKPNSIMLAGLKLVRAQIWPII